MNRRNSLQFKKIIIAIHSGEVGVHVTFVYGFETFLCQNCIRRPGTRLDTLNYVWATLHRRLLIIAD